MQSQKKRNTSRSSALPRIFFSCTAFFSVAGLILMLLSGSYFTGLEKNKLSEIADLSEQSFQSNLEVYTQTLYGVRGFFHSNSGTFSRSEFKSFVESLDLPKRNPALSGIFFLSVVPSNQKESFIDRLKAENDLALVPLADFKFWPESTNDTNVVITYSEPSNLSNVRAALGFDYTTEPTRLAAFKKAVSGNTPVLSDPITSIITKKENFLLILPVYDQEAPTLSPQEREKAISGAAVLSLRRSWLFNTSFELLLKKNPHLRIQAYDGTVQDEATLLYDSNRDEDVLGDNSSLDHQSEVRTIEALGRTWTFVFSLLSSPLVPSTPMLGVILLLLGILGISLVGLAQTFDVFRIIKR